MGIYFVFEKRTLIDIIKLINKLIEGLQSTFNLVLCDKFRLFNEFINYQILESNQLEENNIISAIEKDKESNRDIDVYYYLTIDGVIQLEDDNEKPFMVIDINAYFFDPPNNLNPYGDAFINFYNSDKKWKEYFYGNKSYQINNLKLMNLMKENLKKEFNLKYAFFGSFEDFQKMHIEELTRI